MRSGDANNGDFIIYKGDVVTYFTVSPWNHNRIGNQTDIWTRYFPDTSIQCYRYTKEWWDVIYKFVEYIYWNVRLGSTVLLSISSTHAAPSDSYTGERLSPSSVRGGQSPFYMTPLPSPLSTLTFKHTQTYGPSLSSHCPLNRIPQPTERQVTSWSKCISVVFCVMKRRKSRKRREIMSSFALQFKSYFNFWPSPLSTFLLCISYFLQTEHFAITRLK